MRVLLLSLYFPPLNTIASSRCYAIDNYLRAEGVAVDVITRFYDKQQQEGKSMFLGSEKPSNFQKNYIRENNVIYTNFEPGNAKLARSKKLPPFIKGLYNYYNVDVYHYSWMNYSLDAFEKEWKNNHYDFIISSYGPPIAMLLAKKLSELYKIPYLVDFRDAYINEEDKGIHLWIKKRVQHKLLKNAAGLLFSSKGMADYFKRNSGAQLKNLPSCLVYNGVEDTSAENFHDEDQPVIAEFNKIQKKHSLVLLHTGTLYSGQNISFFTEGIKKYNELQNKSVCIVFLGLAENNTNNLIAGESIYFLPKVKQQTAMFLQKHASALVLPIWNDRYTGFSGKTQEYLYSENIIITSPDPQEDLREFFEISPNVIIPDPSNDLSKIITALLEKKIIKKPLHQKEKLFRSYWVKKLFHFLLQLK